MKKEKTKVLAEGSLMLALAIVLALITPFKRIFPFGGSITLMSMLPIGLFSIKRGLKNGLVLSFAFSLFQLTFAITYEGLLGWGLSGVMLFGSIMLDYIVAFTLLFTNGLFRYKKLPGWIAGTVIAHTLRFTSHFISGVVIFASTGKIWDGLDFVAENKYSYSLVYNGLICLPEMILTLVGMVMAYNITPIRSFFEPVPAKSSK